MQEEKEQAVLATYIVVCTLCDQSSPKMVVVQLCIIYIVYACVGEWRDREQLVRCLCHQQSQVHYSTVSGLILLVIIISRMLY